MASASENGGLPPNFFLTPQQQNLLFAALNSNRMAQNSASVQNNSLSLSPTSLNQSPLQGDSLQESPYLDNYSYDMDPDSSFDFDLSNADMPKMIGDLPGTDRATTKSESTENETHDKRSRTEDDDDTADQATENGNSAKRRESTEKVPKKPGRKPLTTEPSSKRKAQNRAAQRAFRERKEKHVKDLETKVEELEKASEAVNHENDVLRAQLDSKNKELAEYKQRVALLSSNRTYPPQKPVGGFGHAALNNLNDVNFQFEFPKFGMLPGPPIKQSRSTASLSPPSLGMASSPATSLDQLTDSGRSPSDRSQLDKQAKEMDLAKFSGIFSPPLTNSTVANASRGGSMDSGHLSVGPTATSSPSASSNSNMGPSSSCGTSPEPFTQSPMGFKPLDTMTTIGEEQPPMTTDRQGYAQFGSVDLSSGFDWLAQQNGGQFDPQLFGDYREPQDNILSSGLFDESFFNDALDADFFMPYNTGPTSTTVAETQAAKPNLIAQIDAKKEAEDNDQSQGEQTFDYNKMWEKLKNCPKVQQQEIDLDGLCSDLQKKAKCSGNGPTVAEKDFKEVVSKWMGKDGSCVDSKR